MQNYTLAIVGDSFVGKSAFIQRLISNDFIINYEPTIGLAINSILLLTVDGYVTCQLLELGCRSKDIIKLLPAADGVIIMFDYSNSASCLSIHEWYQECCKITSNIIFCGNKTDVAAGGFHHMTNYYDISVKDNIVQTAFYAVMSKVIGYNELIVDTNMNMSMDDVVNDKIKSDDDDNVSFVDWEGFFNYDSDDDMLPALPA